jgi:hypothetical protein
MFLALSWLIPDMRTNMQPYGFIRQIWLQRDDRQAELQDIDLKAGTYRRCSHANFGPVLGTEQLGELAVRLKQQRGLCFASDEWKYGVSLAHELIYCYRPSHNELDSTMSPSR